LNEGQLSSNDKDLFEQTISSKKNLQPYSLIFPHSLTSVFEPTFDDELTPDPSIVAACKNDSSCISDATISGLISMGVDTKSGQAAVQNSLAQTSENFFIDFLIQKIQF
jgi:hypothetical protein